MPSTLAASDLSRLELGSKDSPTHGQWADIQALASERELLVALFGDDATNGAAGQVEDAVSPRSRPPDMPSTSALLDQVFESICRPLKVTFSSRCTTLWKTDSFAGSTDSCWNSFKCIIPCFQKYKMMVHKLLS